jgi:hypothetical protein
MKSWNSAVETNWSSMKLLSWSFQGAENSSLMVHLNSNFHRQKSSNSTESLSLSSLDGTNSMR